MRSTIAPRGQLAVLLLALTLGLAACGGGGSSSTTAPQGGSLAEAPGSGSQAGEAPPTGAGEGPPPGSIRRRHPARSPRGSASREEYEPDAGLAASPPQVPRETSESPGANASGAHLGPSSGSGRAGHRPITPASAKAATHRRLAQQAGAAAPFLVEAGDNSIPTYGTEAAGGQASAGEAAITAYLSARAAGEWAAACQQMSAQVRKQLTLVAGEGGSCAQAYANLAARTPDSARADPLPGGLTALRVESPHAFALFYGPGEQQYMMPLEEEGGVWKVSLLEPMPWPIGSKSN